MIRTIAVLAAAGMLAASAVQAQNAPPPGNVNPGSTESGAEQTGAPNQPRSQNGGAMKGTTGSGMTAPAPRARPNDDGINANVKPSSPETGSEPAGEPAPQRR